MLLQKLIGERLLKQGIALPTAGIIAIVILLSGCGQPTANNSAPSGVPAEASQSASTTATPSRDSGQSSKSEPTVRLTPPGSYDPYAVDPSLAPEVAAKCNALDIGEEVFAAAGRTTLRGDSVIVTPEKYTCVFATGDVSTRGPNWLAVSVFTSGGPATYKTFKDQIAGAGGKVEPAAVTGADSAFWVTGGKGPGGNGIGNLFVVLFGEQLYHISAYFSDVPADAQLNPDAYSAIAKKINS